MRVEPLQWASAHDDARVHQYRADLFPLLPEASKSFVLSKVVVLQSHLHQAWSTSYPWSGTIMSFMGGTHRVYVALGEVHSKRNISGPGDTYAVWVWLHYCELCVRAWGGGALKRLGQRLGCRAAAPQRSCKLTTQLIISMSRSFMLSKSWQSKLAALTGGSVCTNTRW